MFFKNNLIGLNNGACTVTSYEWRNGDRNVCMVVTGLTLSPKGQELCPKCHCIYWAIV